MNNDNIINEFVCYDAYKLLQQGAKESLKALECGRYEEATEMLRSVILLADNTFARCADRHLFGQK